MDYQTLRFIELRIELRTDSVRNSRPITNPSRTATKCAVLAQVARHPAQEVIPLTDIIRIPPGSYSRDKSTGEHDPCNCNDHPHRDDHRRREPVFAGAEPRGCLCRSAVFGQDRCGDHLAGERNKDRDKDEFIEIADDWDEVWDQINWAEDIANHEGCIQAGIPRDTWVAIRQVEGMRFGLEQSCVLLPGVQPRMFHHLLIRPSSVSHPPNERHHHHGTDRYRIMSLTSHATLVTWMNMMWKIGTTMADAKTSKSDEGTHDDDDLADLLNEIRVLLPGAQVLTAFLIILPFSQGFSQLNRTEQWVYLATFGCSLFSMVCFTSPAAQHRLERPLRDRDRFKRDATRAVIIGLVPLSCAWLLATHLVVNEIVGWLPGIVFPAVLALLIGTLWWIFPLWRRREHQERHSHGQG